VKKTKWFKGVEPVRKGVYQRRYSWGVNYAYFDGTDWGLSSETVAEARQWGVHSKKRTYGGLPWRGLVTKGGGA
jgi:hypothetical protein